VIDGTCYCYDDDIRGHFDGETCDICAKGYIVPDCLELNVGVAVHYDDALAPEIFVTLSPPPETEHSDIKGSIAFAYDPSYPIFILSEPVAKVNYGTPTADVIAWQYGTPIMGKVVGKSLLVLTNLGNFVEIDIDTASAPECCSESDFNVLELNTFLPQPQTDGTTPAENNTWSGNSTSSGNGTNSGNSTGSHRRRSVVPLALSQAPDSSPAPPGAPPRQVPSTAPVPVPLRIPAGSAVLGAPNPDKPRVPIWSAWSAVAPDRSPASSRAITICSPDNSTTLQAIPQTAPHSGLDQAFPYPSQWTDSGQSSRLLRKDVVPQLAMGRRKFRPQENVTEGGGAEPVKVLPTAVTGCEEVSGLLYCVASGTIERLILVVDRVTRERRALIDLNGRLDVVHYILYVPRNDSWSDPGPHVAVAGSRKDFWEIVIVDIADLARAVGDTDRTQTSIAFLAGKLLRPEVEFRTDIQDFCPNWCKIISRMFVSESMLYAATIGDQTLMVLGIDLNSKTLVATNPIPHVYSVAKFVMKITALLVDQTSQSGFVAVNSDGIVEADTQPSILYKFNSYGRLSTTGSTEMAVSTVSNPDRSISRAAEVIVALSAMTNGTRIMYVLVMQKLTIRMVLINLFAIKEVSPDHADGRGGTVIDIYGLGMPPNNFTRCRFGTAEQNATVTTAVYIEKDHIQCIAPPSATGGEESCVGQKMDVDVTGMGRWSKNEIPLKRIATATINTLIPNRRNLAGGLITIIGFSFVDTKYKKCRFFTDPELFPEINDAQITTDVKFFNTTIVFCPQPRFPKASMVPAYVEVSLDGQMWSNSKVEYNVIGYAVGIRVRPESFMDEDRAIFLKGNATMYVPPLVLVTVDSNEPLPQGHELLVFDESLREIRVELESVQMSQAASNPLIKGVNPELMGVSVNMSIDGEAFFLDLYFAMCPKGAYTLRFSTTNTEQLPMEPRGRRDAQEADSVASVAQFRQTDAFWSTTQIVYIQEGTPVALYLSQQPQPLALDNKNAFLSQPILVLLDGANNIIEETHPGMEKMMVTVEYLGFVYGFPCSKGWDISAPYYPCYDTEQSEGSIKFRETVSINENKEYVFTRLKLVGLHNMTYRLQFYAIGEMGNLTIANVSSELITVAKCGTDGHGLKFETLCVACPANAICDGTTEFVVSDNHWRRTNVSLVVYFCERSFACIGNTPTGTCKEGYVQGSPVCTECDVGYAVQSAGKGCAPCPSMAVNAIMLFFLFIAVLGVFSFIVKGNLNPADADLMPLLQKQMINYLQVSTLISDFNIELPPAVQTMLETQKSGSNMEMQANGMECVIFQSDQIRRFQIYMFVPWIVFFGTPFVVIALRKINATFLAPWAEKKRKKNLRLANLEDWDTIKLTFLESPPWPTAMKHFRMAVAYAIYDTDQKAEVQSQTYRLDVGPEGNAVPEGGLPVPVSLPLPKKFKDRVIFVQIYKNEDMPEKVEPGDKKSWQERFQDPSVIGIAELKITKKIAKQIVLTPDGEMEMTLKVKDRAHKDLCAIQLLVTGIFPKLHDADNMSVDTCLSYSKMPQNNAGAHPVNVARSASVTEEEKNSFYNSDSYRSPTVASETASLLSSRPISDNGGGSSLSSPFPEVTKPPQGLGQPAFTFDEVIKPGQTADFDNVAKPLFTFDEVVKPGKKTSSGSDSSALQDFKPSSSSEESPFPDVGKPFPPLETFTFPAPMKPDRGLLDMDNYPEGYHTSTTQGSSFPDVQKPSHTDAFTSSGDEPRQWSSNDEDDTKHKMLDGLLELSTPSEDSSHQGPARRPGYATSQEDSDGDDESKGSDDGKDIYKDDNESNVTGYTERMWEVEEAFDGEDDMWGLLDKEAQRGLFPTLALTVIILLYFLYPTIIKQCAMMMQKCIVFDTGKNQTDYRGLPIDYVVDCDSDRFKTNYKWAIFCFLGYGCGVPAIAMLFIHITMKQSGKRAALKWWGFLTRFLTDDAWWWESVVMLRKLALVFISVFISEALYQIFFSMWVIYASLFLNFHFKPYSLPVLRRLEGLSSAMLLVMLNLCMFFAFEDMPTSVLLIAGVLLLLCLVFTLSVFIRLIALEIFRKIMLAVLNPAPASPLMEPIRRFLRGNFLLYFDKLAVKAQALDMLNKGEGEDSADHSPTVDRIRCLCVTMLDPTPEDLGDLDTITKLVGIIMAMVPRSISKYVVISGCEAWLEFVTVAEKRFFHMDHQRVDIAGRFFYIEDLEGDEDHGLLTATVTHSVHDEAESATALDLEIQSEESSYRHSLDAYEQGDGEGLGLTDYRYTHWRVQGAASLREDEYGIPVTGEVFNTFDTPSQDGSPRVDPEFATPRKPGTSDAPDAPLLQKGYDPFHSYTELEGSVNPNIKNPKKNTANSLQKPGKGPS